MRVDGKENITKRNVLSEDRLKEEFGCNPPEKWDLMKKIKIGIAVRNVCISKEYQVNEAPKMDNPTTVVNIFHDIKVLEVDEIKKTITINIWMWSIWEDPRIKAKLSNIDAIIMLPPITKHAPIIWHPFLSTYIVNLKKLDYIYDPIIIKFLVLFSSQNQKYLSLKLNPQYLTNVFPPNTTLVFAAQRFDVILSCDFNFSSYPLDHQTCPFRIISDIVQPLKLYYSPDVQTNRPSSKQHEFQGFDITRVLVGSSLDYNGVYGNETTTFGIDIKMNRQIAAYVYQYYLPCIAIVVGSGMSFIVPLSEIPGRVVLVVTQFLTLTNIFIHQIVRLELIK